MTDVPLPDRGVVGKTLPVRDQITRRVNMAIERQLLLQIEKLVFHPVKRQTWFQIRDQVNEDYGAKR